MKKLLKENLGIAIIIMTIITMFVVYTNGVNRINKNIEQCGSTYCNINK